VSMYIVSGLADRIPIPPNSLEHTRASCRTRVVLNGDEDTTGASLYFSCGSAWAESDVEKGVFRMIQVCGGCSARS
jgi:hypothetical protein